MNIPFSTQPISPAKRVYWEVAMRGTCSKADLLPASGMTMSSLTRLLDEMVSDRLLVQSGYGPSSGGRKPILYELNADYGYIFGLEISRRTSSLILFDAKLNPKSLIRWRMDEAMTPEQFVEYVAVNIRSILQDHRIDRQQVLGIGVGAVGPIDRMNGIILNPQNFPSRGWSNVPICDMLKERTALDARLENGANAALIGEHWSMRGENLQHLLYVHAGVGLRSAMMSGGQIVHGSVDMEGAVGQMIIQMDGPKLHDQMNYGSWESYVSVQAMEHIAQSHAKQGRSDVPGSQHVAPEKISFDLLLQGLTAGNAYARELFTQTAVHFGIGLANLINVLHPEKIILGGPLVNADSQFFGTATDIARRHTYYYPAYEPIFTTGILKEDAVSVGSALMLWQELNIPPT